MSKELTPLEALEEIKHTTDLYRPNELNGYKEELDIIETALKEKEQQDTLIRVLKEVFEFGIINEKVIEKNDGSLTLSGQIGYNLRREISNKEKTLYRDFILKECFPKELKALEIIKELIYINDNNQVRFLPKNKAICAITILEQDIADLLKEVLLWLI